jgi:hypothetical protein
MQLDLWQLSNLDVTVVVQFMWLIIILNYVALQ